MIYHLNSKDPDRYYPLGRRRGSHVGTWMAFGFVVLVCIVVMLWALPGNVRQSTNQSPTTTGQATDLKPSKAP